MAALEWLSASFLAQALTASPTLYLFVNAAHILSIGILAGAILPLDLRILGFFSRFPLSVLGPFLSRSAMAGVVLAMLTGMTLFTVKAPEYAANVAFLTKLVLLGGGIANALLLHAHAGWQDALKTERASVSVKVFATISLIAWIAAIVAGRWIGFL